MGSGGGAAGLHNPPPPGTALRSGCHNLRASRISNNSPDSFHPLQQPFGRTKQCHIHLQFCSDIRKQGPRRASGSRPASALHILFKQFGIWRLKMRGSGRQNTGRSPVSWAREEGQKGQAPAARRAEVSTPAATREGRNSRKPPA